MRLSGPDAAAIASTIVRLRSDLCSWKASLGELLDSDDAIVDEVVVTFFAAARSYTAEDVAEIACHGSPVVLRHCLERSLGAGARLAEPGEFTMRAFLNGRIDLPQAEAVRDLIDSTTLYQARVAARQTQGSVSRRLAPTKAQLVELIALLEASTSTSPRTISAWRRRTEILRRLEPVVLETNALARSFAYGNLVRNGFSLAIVGPPNAGKSSLFNRLLHAGPRHRYRHSGHHPRPGFGERRFLRHTRSPRGYRGHSRNQRTHRDARNRAKFSGHG